MAETGYKAQGREVPDAIHQGSEAKGSTAQEVAALDPELKDLKPRDPGS